jgi:hypothetical protein
MNKNQWKILKEQLALNKESKIKIKKQSEKKLNQL